MTELKYWKAINLALQEEMERDDAVCLIGEDVGRPGGPFGATKGLFDRYGPRRVRDTPISENTLVGLAIGASMTGIRPIVEIMFLDFLPLALDQLINVAAKVSYMSAGEYRAPIVVRTVCGAGRGSGPQHSQHLEELVHVPGLRVVMPSSPADARALLKAAVRSDDPVVVIESLRLWSDRAEVSTETDEVLPLDTAAIRRSGSDVTVVSWGAVVPRALEAAAQAAKSGVNAEVVDLRSVSPLDEVTLLDSVRRTGRLLVVQDSSGNGGVAARVLSSVVTAQCVALRCAPQTVVAPFAPVPFPRHLENQYYPQSDAIAESILSICARAA